MPDSYRMCRQCVLTTAVPRVTLDDDGVCSVCREYEARKATYDAYFRTEDDLRVLFGKTHDSSAPFDVLLMYSGGKDSTYVLCRLVEMGLRVLAVTFDNGYVPRQCFDNIERVCTNLGVESLIVGADRKVMDEVFAESLRADATVCTGCFRGLTARGTEIAVARRIPIVMTGLSRGQIYDTKVHQLVSNGVTDADQIDALLHVFREGYHRQNDKIASLIQDRAVADPKAFKATQFIDFFRYSPVKKTDILALIAERTPFWKLPQNVGGCSSNCLINDVGIQVHLEKRGYHNYAIPASWDIRFGHITRADALAEVSELPDEPKVRQILKVLNV